MEMEPIVKEVVPRANTKLLSAMQKHDRVMGDIRGMKTTLEENTIFIPLQRVY